MKTHVPLIMIMYNSDKPRNSVGDSILEDMGGEVVGLAVLVDEDEYDGKTENIAFRVLTSIQLLQFSDKYDLKLLKYLSTNSFDVAISLMILYAVAGSSVP